MDFSISSKYEKNIIKWFILVCWYLASLLVNNGANITVVAKYLGHTKIEESLNTYTHLFNSALNEVVHVIDNLENKG